MELKFAVARRNCRGRDVMSAQYKATHEYLLLELVGIEKGTLSVAKSRCFCASRSLRSSYGSMAIK